MEVVIIGTNGFLSTAIAIYCIEKRYNVSMYGLEPPREHGCQSFHKINFMEESLDYESIIAADMIIYAVGAGIQSNLKEKNDLIYNLNTTIPVNICNKLKEFGYAGCFVTFGSVFEIGESEKRMPFSERDIITALNKAPNDYAVSKRMLTRFIDSYQHEFIHWHFIIPTIYGEKENPKRLVPYTINAIKNGEPLHFTAGDQTRQYIHVSEIPRIIELAFSKEMPSGIYNIEGKETMTVKEIVNLIHCVYGKKVPVDCFGSTSRSDVGMKYLALDGSKLKQAIGFNAIVKMEDVIKRY